MSDRLKTLEKKFALADEAYQKLLDTLIGKDSQPTEAEAQEVARLEAETKRLSEAYLAEKAAEERRQEIARSAAAAAAPAQKDVTGTIANVQKSSIIRAEVVQKKLTATQKFSVFLKGIVSQYHDVERRSAWEHIKSFGYEQLGDEWQSNLQAENKTLSTLSSGAGGYAVPTVLSNEFIDWLYPQSVFLAGNPTMVDLSAGNLNITGGNASSTASYRAENANIAYSDASFRQVALVAKNLAAITAMTNELIGRSPMAIDTFVQSDLRRAFLTTMDLALQRGDGTSNTPTGIRNAVSSTYRIAAVNNTAPSPEDVEDELRRILLLVMNSNMGLERPAWQMAPRTFLFLESLRNIDGSKAFPEVANKMLKGFPIIMSTQIPINLGGGTDESEISFTNFGHVLFGDTKAMTLAVSREATYDVSGTLNSAFSKNQTVIRLIGAHDVDCRYDPACTTLTAVRWGV